MTSSCYTMTLAFLFIKHGFFMFSMMFNIFLTNAKLSMVPSFLLLLKIKCKIHLHEPWLVQPHRENNKNIMDTIMNDDDITTQNRHIINRCRIYATHIANKYVKLVDVCKSIIVQSNISVHLL